MWILTLFLGVAIGTIIMGILAGGATEAENFWEHLYMNERDAHKGTQKLLDEMRLKERGVI